MKKLMMMFAVAIVATTIQTANAQLSLNVNIGTQPRYGYFNDYYARPVIHRTYYAPAARYVYVKKHQTHYRPARVYHTYNARPSAKYYKAKNNHYKHHGKANKHHGRHGKGRH